MKLLTWSEFAAMPEGTIFVVNANSEDYGGTIFRLESVEETGASQLTTIHVVGLSPRTPNEGGAPLVVGDKRVVSPEKYFEFIVYEPADIEALVDMLNPRTPA